MLDEKTEQIIEMYKKIDEFVKFLEQETMENKE